MTKSSKQHVIEEGSFLSSYGERAHIYYKHYLPQTQLKKSKKKIVHLIFQHGMIEYHKRHDDFFDSLIEHFEKKMIISTMDLVGHGLSGGHRGHINEFKTYTEDMLTFFEICHKRIYGDIEPITIIVSHSLGGLITLRTLTSEEYQLPFKVDSTIFVNPCISPKLELPKAALHLIENLPDTLSRVRIPLIYDAYDLSQDEDKAISFIHDHLISKSITINLGLETLKATKHINSLSYFYKTPCFFILSGDDRVVDNEKTQLFITGMDKNIVKVKYYPNMRHDILNETCRIDVFREIIEYIENHRKEYA